MIRPLLTLGLCTLLTACQRPQTNPPYEPQEGDILLQSLPHNPLVDTIEGATDSPFSHCGIVHRNGSQWVVIEALGTVHETPLPAWIAQARDQRCVAYRLKPSFREKIPSFIQAAKTFEGRPYDIHYRMDDEAIYCSELIYKAFLQTTNQKLGQIKKLKDLNWQPYSDIIKEIEGGILPLERKMITPRDLSEAPQLIPIYPTPQL